MYNIIRMPIQSAAVWETLKGQLTVYLLLLARLQMLWKVSATGVGEIAEKTTDIVSDTMQNMNLVDSCREAIDQLQSIVDQFEL